MTSSVPLGSSVEYSRAANPLRWERRVVDDRERFGRYMHEVVRLRITDEHRLSTLSYRVL